MRFYKYQATGNDFIIIDEFEAKQLNPALIKTLCDRRFGIGADGLIINAYSENHDATMIFYNPDGSVAEMCGNGIRCLAAYILSRGTLNPKRVLIDTKKGPKMVTVNEVPGKKTYTVNMGEPGFYAQDIPVALDLDELIDYEIKVEENNFKISAVSMGNPHAVIFIDDIESIDLEKIGPIIETNELFPNKTNVEFVEVVDKTNIKMLVWERGAGVTLSCGTGACAAAVQAAKHGFTERKVNVLLPGGSLEIEWSEDNLVFLTGPAYRVFEGNF